MQTTTEHLIDAAVERLDGAEARIAVVGPGAHALAIAVTARLPTAEVEAWADAARAQLPLGLDLLLADLSSLPARGEGVDDYRRLLAGAADHLSSDGGVLIQVRRQVLEAERSELPWLSARLEALQATAV